MHPHTLMASFPYGVFNAPCSCRWVSSFAYTSLGSHFPHFLHACIRVLRALKKSSLRRRPGAGLLLYRSRANSRRFDRKSNKSVLAINPAPAADTYHHISGEATPRLDTILPSHSDMLTHPWSLETGDNAPHPGAGVVSLQ